MSRVQNTVRRTWTEPCHTRAGSRQGTFSSQPEVSMLTGSKMMAHYVVLYISGDLDRDLGPIVTKFRLW
jgi:hypothetical protein